MADKLQFSLVSPVAELFSGLVDQVDVPGSEGDFGVFADHAPFMAAIRTGAITVFNEGVETKYLIQGGFADVMPSGLTILAEQATLLSEVSADDLASDIASAEQALADSEGDASLDAAQHLDGLKMVQETL
ncbi:MAG: ATP synthase F1 subunit epsilon [Robiginitomaculum sp.]|nr:MAG: ATP synthase F1 subunit epsilon [Robiginitomaculum sp.]